MKLIGLAGPAGVGKDTIADYLVDTYNFTKFSFSDMLYEEVALAFGIDKAGLYERTTKEQPSPALQYWFCKDKTFQNLMFHLLKEQGVGHPMDYWASPRWVLQRWGTDYRRKEDPEYWIKRSDMFVQAYLANAAEDPEYPRGGLVNCSVRFPNERAFIAKYNGEIWHVQRPGWGETMGAAEKSYIAEQGLPMEPQDKEIINGSTIASLGTGASLLLGSGPGTRISLAPIEPDFHVSCADCGKLYIAYTEAQAKQEIEGYNEWMKLNAPENSPEAVGEGLLSLDDFRDCDRCGATQFILPTAFSDEFDPEEKDSMTGVIYEGPRS